MSLNVTLSFVTPQLALKNVTVAVDEVLLGENRTSGQIITLWWNEGSMEGLGDGDYNEMEQAALHGDVDYLTFALSDLVAVTISGGALKSLTDEECAVVEMSALECAAVEMCALLDLYNKS